VIQALQRSNPTLAAEGYAILDRVEAVRNRKRLDPSRPCITLSYAQSLDGCIAADDGLPTVISNPQTLVLTHYLRAMHDALLVGVNTVIVDDPQLTVRLAPGDNPTPVIVDSSLRMPLDAQLLGQDSRPLVATVEGSKASRRGALEAKGVDVVSVAANPEGGIDLVDLFATLRARGIRSVFVEGGAKNRAPVPRRRTVGGAAVWTLSQPPSHADRYRLRDDRRRSRRTRRAAAVRQWARLISSSD